MHKLGKLLAVVSIFIFIFLFFSVGTSAEGVKIGTVTADVLNVRKAPELDAEISTKLSNGIRVCILEISDEWYKINHNNREGWVYGQYIFIEDEVIGIGSINGNNVNIRTKPDLSSEVITMLDKGEKLNVYDRMGDWYKVMLPSEKLGWVYSDYILVKEISISRGVNLDAVSDVVLNIKEINESKNTLREQIVEYAKKYLGVKYVYGGTSPKGFDCSGFVQYVYKNFGIELERVASSQASHGKKIDKKDLKVGDLVFFDTNGGLNSIEHVGIYVGEGKFIHASSGRSARKVVISSLAEGFYANTYMRSRCYIE